MVRILAFGWIMCIIHFTFYISLLFFAKIIDLDVQNGSLALAHLGAAKGHLVLLLDNDDIQKRSLIRAMLQVICFARTSLDFKW